MTKNNMKITHLKFHQNLPGADALTDCGLVASDNSGNVGSRNGLLPDGTKPLPEPMLAYHQ